MTQECEQKKDIFLTSERSKIIPQGRTEIKEGIVKQRTLQIWIDIYKYYNIII